MAGANVPKLRFPEFSGEWEEKKFGDLFKIGSGKDYKHLGSGNIPVYGTGGYMLSVDDYLYQGESVCIGRKGTIDNPVLLNGKFWTVDTLFYTHSFDECIPRFIYAIFQNVKWKEHNEGSGVPSLSKSTIEKLCSIIPSTPEQTKIAEFLGVVDEKIKALRQKHGLLKDYKRGVMQKIFTQQIRFKKDDGTTFPDWEDFAVEAVFDRVTKKNDVDNQNVLTISAQNGLISQLEFFNKSVSAKDLTGYYLLEKGCFAYNKSYSNGYPMGAIKRLNRYQFGVVSTLYICFKPKNPKCSDFYEQYFESGLFNHEIQGIAQEGARNHGLLNLSVLEFFKLLFVPYPHPDEQQKIANFLSSIDNKIDATQSQIDQMTQFKKGLLQQMFV